MLITERELRKHIRKLLLEESEETHRGGRLIAASDAAEVKGKAARYKILGDWTVKNSRHISPQIADIFAGGVYTPAAPGDPHSLRDKVLEIVYNAQKAIDGNSLYDDGKNISPNNPLIRFLRKQGLRGKKLVDALWYLLVNKPTKIVHGLSKNPADYVEIFYCFLHAAITGEAAYHKDGAGEDVVIPSTGAVIEVKTSAKPSPQTQFNKSVPQSSPNKFYLFAQKTTSESAVNANLMLVSAEILSDFINISDVELLAYHDSKKGGETTTKERVDMRIALFNRISQQLQAGVPSLAMYILTKVTGETLPIDKELSPGPGGKAKMSDTNIHLGKLKARVAASFDTLQPTPKDVEYIRKAREDIESEYDAADEADWVSREFEDETAEWIKSHS